MTQKVSIIGLIPVDLDEFARNNGFGHTLVPTEGYTKTKCHECKRDAWIGPRQLAVYQSNPGPFALLCFPCIVLNYDGQVMMSLGNANSARIEPLL